MKRIILSIILASALTTAVANEAVKPAAQQGSNKLLINGIPVTGWNQIYGAPATDLRFVGSMNFDVAGVYNPNGKALPITATTSPDALLASYAAPEVYLAFFGVADAENAPDQNIPYADYPHLISHDSQFGPIPQLSENPDWFGISNGSENRGLTVRRWLEISGTMRLECKPGKRPFYAVDVRDAIPGGLYTVWGFYFDQQANQLMPDYAFGGTSANAFVADMDGRIEGKRALNHCPQDATTYDRYVPVATFLVYHPDGRVNAAVGHIVATPPYAGPGMTATPEIMFPMPKAGF